MLSVQKITLDTTLVIISFSEWLINFCFWDKKQLADQNLIPEVERLNREDRNVAHFSIIKNRMSRCGWQKNMCSHLCWSLFTNIYNSVYLKNEYNVEWFIYAKTSALNRFLLYLLRVRSVLKKLAQIYSNILIKRPMCVCVYMSGCSLPCLCRVSSCWSLGIVRSMSATHVHVCRPFSVV